MKWFPALILCALGLAFNACEQHPASELEDAHGAADSHPPAAKHEPAPVHGTLHDTKPADGAAAPGEAPKFFPEKK